MKYLEFCKRHWKTIVGVVLGLPVLATLTLVLLCKFNLISVKKPSEGCVDRHSNTPYSGMEYDGIDVSKHNGVIQWQQVATNKNIRFVYIKATEGSTLQDRRYRKNLKGAKAQGLLVGSYHFLSSMSPIRKQFDNFRRQAKKADQDLIPVLDVEAIGIKGRWTPHQLRDSVALFASLVKQHYGKLPVIYTGEGFYRGYLTPYFDHYLLFIANYKRRPILKNNALHNLWQYSQHGHVKGICEYVDLIKLDNDTRLGDLRLH